MPCLIDADKTWYDINCFTLMGENIAIIYSANKISFNDTHPAFVFSLKVGLICWEFALDSTIPLITIQRVLFIS